MNGINISVLVTGRIWIIRMMPYPPSFNRIAANTIDPAMGASTWALGSQRWSPYTGIFARNADRLANHNRRAVHWFSGLVIWVKRVGEKVRLLRKITATRRGSEVVSVYSIKYVPAVRRSACWPHRVMRIRVGMSVASNITYIRVRLYAVNVKEIKSCSVVRVARKTRCR